MTDPRLAIEQERTEQEQERTERVREHEKSGRFKAFMDAVPLLATLATATVAVFGSLQSQQQYRDTQASERFQSAVELLAGDDLTTRVGGIALLGQVQQRAARKRRAAARHLPARSLARDRGRPHKASGHGPPPTEEVRAVLSALQYRGDVKGVDLGRISARNLMESGTDLTGLVFARSDLSGSLLEGANLTGVPFRQATLRGVNFRGADLTRAAFQEADLTGAQLQGADLSGADLTQVKGLTSAMLAGATTDADTRLPDGITVPPAEPASTVKPPVR